MRIRWLGIVALWLVPAPALAQEDMLSSDPDPGLARDEDPTPIVEGDERELDAEIDAPELGGDLDTSIERDAGAVSEADATTGDEATTRDDAQTPPGKRTLRTADIARCVALAEANYPKIRGAQAKLRQARAQSLEARGAPFSQFTGKSSLGLGPTVEGTSIYSPNTSLEFNKPALFWRIGFEGVLPVWTFGKITAAWDAADAQIDLRKFEILKEKNDVRVAVYRAYYGLLLARDARILVDDALGQIQKYVDQLEEKVEDDEADETDLIKIRLKLAELQARDSEAKQQEEIALESLRFLTGQQNLDAVDEPIERAPHELQPLSEYMASARVNRPEVRMAGAGVRVAQAQVDLMRAKFYPDIGVALGAEWAEAPEVTDQLNPFVSDAGNFVQYGFAFALRWNLDFAPAVARLDRANAQLDEIQSVRDFALGGVRVEVTQAYADASHAMRRLSIMEDSVSLAKRWIFQVQQGIDIGVTPEKDIAEPAKEYALKRFERLRAIHDYNVALARLAQVTGWTNIDPFR